MGKPLSLLVVDMEEGWEEFLKSLERGHNLVRGPGGREYYRDELDAFLLFTLKYPHGSTRAGFNAIIDTTRLAHECGLPVYAVEYDDGHEPPESRRTCSSLRPYVPAGNRYEKRAPDAFTCELAERLEREGCRHLLVVGYDRDRCVLETVQGAVNRGITVAVSEQCMLTTDMHSPGRKHSLAYFRENAVFLESLADVWNYILAAAAAVH